VLPNLPVLLYVLRTSEVVAGRPQTRVIKNNSAFKDEHSLNDIHLLTDFNYFICEIFWYVKYSTQTNDADRCCLLL